MNRLLRALLARRCGLYLMFGLAMMLWYVQPAAAQGHWVTTWATAQQLVRPAPPQRPAGASGPAGAEGAPARPAPPRPQAGGAPGRPAPIPDLTNKTIRMIAHTSVGGARVRITLADAFGDQQVAIGAAHIALQDKDSAIVAGSDRAVSFGGKSSVTLLPGVATLSDPVDLSVPAGSNLAVSLFVPENPGPLTVHTFGMHTAYISKEGDTTGAMAFDDPATMTSYIWLASVDVLAPGNAGTVVALGDSIVDGYHSTLDANHMWVAMLADRLRTEKQTANVGVANEGIAGNRLLTDGAGASALGRFDRDVIGLAGVKWVILSEGLNDISTLLRPEAGGRPLTVDDLIAGYKQAIEQAHLHGLKIIGCTMTPSADSFIYSDKGEEVREAGNQWIRTSGAFDAVLDLDAVLRDKGNPKKIRADFDSGDHLHPNDDGYKAMADSIDLTIFKKR